MCKREASMTAVREYAPRIIDAADGFKLLSAITVLHMLIKIGKPQPYISANALGNVLGHEGFKLPSITILGKRRYAIHLIESSDGEKAQFQAWLDGLDGASRCRLHVA